MCLCVSSNFTVCSHAQLNSSVAQFGVEGHVEGGGGFGVRQNGNLQVHSA